MTIPKYTLLLISFFFLLSCNENPYLKGKPDQTLNITFQRFEKELNTVNPENINQDKVLLQEKYGEFFNIYNEGIIRLGNYQSEDYNAHLLHFLDDSIYNSIYDSVAHDFTDLKTEEIQLSKAFRNYKLLFPERQIPQCYTHISGFNTPIVVGDSILSISLENYLGEEHVFYKKLGTYTYLLPHKNREHLAVDAMRGWLVSEFPDRSVKNHLLNTIIYEGKLLFIQQLLMPEEEASLILNLTPEQYTWCEENEMSVWRFMIEKQHLFSKEKTTIAKYIQDGPFFNFYGQGSSPLVGKYIGWQIVNAYMEKNKDLSVDDLLNTIDGQAILASSGYRP